MRHLKTVMIIAVLLMILGFSVSVLFGMWCMYEEGIHEPKRMEESIKQAEISYKTQKMPSDIEIVGEYPYRSFMIQDSKRETDKRRGQPRFGCPHVQTEGNILTNVWSLEVIMKL